MQIGKEYPVFILNNYKHNATWDTVDTITWIVINAYGEKIVDGGKEKTTEIVVQAVSNT